MSAKTSSRKSSESYQNKAEGLAIYKRLASYATKHWKYIILAVLGLVVSGTTVPLFAIYMQPLLDGTFLNKDPEVIRWAPIALLVIFLLRGIASFMSGYAIELIGRSIVKEIRSELFARLLRLPVSYYDKNNSGQLVTRLIYHVEQIALASSKGLKVLVQDTVIVIGSVAVMFYLSWKLAVIILFVAPIIAGLIAYISRRFRKLSSKIQEQVGEVTQISSEVISATREIRIFDGLEYEMARFEEINERNYTSYMKRVVTEGLSMPIVQFIMAIALAIVVYSATHGEQIKTFTAGSFMAFMTAMIALFDPLKRLTNVSSVLQGGVAAGQSIFSLLDEEPEKDTGTKTFKGRAKGAFKFDNVSFRYPNQKMNENSETVTNECTKTQVLKQTSKVLDEISFSVKPGEKIALVGQSGSGKTTLVNLLPRFYENNADGSEEHGEITLDGISLMDIKLKSLREQFAYVGQDVTLFNTSVRSNIAYGNMRSATDEQIKTAAQAAFALDFIEKMPQGLDTQVGEDGTLLSGGQKQRLAIARAILSDAPILILDEATSALDTKSERHIQKALETLLKNRTTFMIAHRLSTIEKADKILMMDEGKIIESGTHSELLAKNGAYANLYHLQFENG